MKMRLRDASLAAIAVAAIGGLGMNTASAAIAYDQNVTPNVIFGSGNANGGFTVDQNTGQHVELGLRGKLRFDSNNQAQSIYNSDGAGNYSFATGTPNLGIAHPGWATTTTPIWNFDWSINTNFDDTGSFVVGDLFYQMGIDFDPGLGTNYLIIDPINVPFADHSFGDNLTGANAGAEAGNSTVYASYLTHYIVAQNSVNYEFINDGPFSSFDPNANGTYNIFLAAYTDANHTNQLARTSINVVVGAGAPPAVPIPGAVLLFGSGLGMLGFAGRKKFLKKA